MEKEAKKKSSSKKLSAKSKKKLGAAAAFVPPAYGAEVGVLSDFMNKNFFKSLKTCLDLLSGDGTLEVSDVLALSAKYLTGDAGAKVEVQQRLTAREEAEALAKEAAGETSPRKKKRADAVLRMEFDQWVIPSYEAAMLKMMQERFSGGAESGGAAERLARLLLVEAKAFQGTQPRGAIIPSIPQEDKASAYAFAHDVSDSPMIVSEKVNSGSLLLLLEQQVDEADLLGSVSKLGEMLTQELTIQRAACEEAAQLLIRAIKRHRGVKASIDAEDREVVASSLDAIRSVVSTAAQDIVGGCLEAALNKIEVIVSSQELNNALAEQAAAEAPAQEGEGAPPAEAVPAAAAPTNEQQAKSNLEALIWQATKGSEEAVVSMEGAVEAILYDRGADLIAQIFLEERAVVHQLPIRPWQVKVKRTHAALMSAIERVVTRLASPLEAAQGPPPKTDRGREAAERSMPFFEVMTLLISSTCRCLGDAERALGIGLDPDPAWDMEFLQDGSLASQIEEQSEGSEADFQTFRGAMQHTRAKAEIALRDAIKKVVEAAGWTAGLAIPNPEKSVIPGKLLVQQLEMSRALQRLQSRLMCCLKSTESPTLVLWNPDSLKVVQESLNGESPPPSPANSAAVPEAAAMVPVLRVAKRLHEELTDAAPNGEKKIIPWLGQALVNIAELERNCTHVAMEVKGFAQVVQPARSAVLDGKSAAAEAAEKAGEAQDPSANMPSSDKTQPTADVTEAAVSNTGDGEAADPENATVSADGREGPQDDEAALEAAALKELEADLNQGEEEAEQQSPPAEPGLEAEIAPAQGTEDLAIADPEADRVMHEVADILNMVTSFMQGLRQSVSQHLQ